MDYMDVRLVQLLGSFITARSEYALVRLECAMHDPALPAPPVIDRLSDASERALRDEWPAIEQQWRRPCPTGNIYRAVRVNAGARTQLTGHSTGASRA